MNSVTFDDSVDPSHHDAVRHALDAISHPELSGDVDVAVLSGGGSNENFLISADGARHSVLRLTASEAVSRRFRINRVAGLESHLFAQAAGLTPELLGITMPSGDSLTRFLDARMVRTEDITAGTTIEDCMALLRRTHRDGRCSHDFSALDDILAYTELAAAEKLPTPRDLPAMVHAATRIERHFQSLGVPKVHSHSDANTANFLRAEGRLWLVDWEYSGMGNPYFDLGNFVADADLSPVDADRALAGYFGVVRDCDRARLLAQKFMAALREAIWAVVAAPVLGEVQFDHVARAADHFDRARRSLAEWEQCAYFTRAGAQPDDPLVFGRVFGRSG
ncbi:hypothetical protein A5727_08955 [Mycobacterium sp. ACS4331]|nr:hypothetical protein A5727_08955 [Mycobacterium sp. ACS4331]